MAKLKQLLLFGMFHRSAEYYEWGATFHAGSWKHTLLWINPVTRKKLWVETWTKASLLTKDEEQRLIAVVRERTCLECDGSGWFSPTPVKDDGWACVCCNGTGGIG